MKLFLSSWSSRILPRLWFFCFIGKAARHHQGLWRSTKERRIHRRSCHSSVGSLFSLHSAGLLGLLFEEHLKSVFAVGKSSPSPLSSMDSFFGAEHLRRKQAEGRSATNGLVGDKLCRLDSLNALRSSLAFLELAPRSPPDFLPAFPTKNRHISPFLWRRPLSAQRRYLNCRISLPADMNHFLAQPCLARPVLPYLPISR